MRRDEVVQAFLNRYEKPSYLEIGVNHGETFLRIKAARKVAVDPKFHFDTAATASATVILHEVTSDAYFADHAPPGERFDVIYIDGLHTFEQTLRDLLNAVELLNEGGIIVIDDVIPNSFDASLPDEAQVFALRAKAATMPTTWSSDGSWMGDVFKLVFFIETFMQQWSYATVAENHGQAVLWRRTRSVTEIGDRSMEAVARLDYRDTILSRNVFRLTPMAQILAASST